MKNKFYLFFLLYLMIACVSNNGEYYSVGTIAKSKTFDFATPGDYTFNGAVLQVVNDSFSLISSAVLFDDFDDNTSTNYSSALITGMSSTFTEANEVMNGDCTSGSATLIPITNLATNDYVLYHETDPVTFASTAEISTIVRYIDTSNFYRVSSVNGSHSIIINNAGVETVLATTADASFTLSTTKNYATRINVSGTTIEYKVWVPATEAEPSDYIVSTTDATHTTGGFAFYCDSSEMNWDNVYELTADTTNNTIAANTVTFPVYVADGELAYLTSFSLTGSVLDESELLYDISVDGGSTFKTYANYWRENIWARDGAMSLTELNNRIRSLKPSSNTIVIRVYFNSEDGWANPLLTTFTVNYQVLE